MQTVSTIAECRAAVADARGRGERIGCVMTMGALHAGHRSLLEAARDDGLTVVATIFVNPTQFGPGEDFERYPRTLEDDLAICREAGVAIVFTPNADEIYPPGAETEVHVPNLTRPLEGRFRPGHFVGVATVVLKLLNIVQPDVAFFGQKDYQQAAVIRRMVRDLNVPTEIRVRPTKREPDGLAMSSRNRYLSDEERKAALRLSRALSDAAHMLRDRQTSVDDIRSRMWAILSEDDAVAVQYASIADADTLEEIHSPQDLMVIAIAAKVGQTRLIDNVVIDAANAEGPAIPELDTSETQA